MKLSDWKPRRKHTFGELVLDQNTPEGKQGFDSLLLEESGDDYYGRLGEIVESSPIVSAGIRRS